MSKYSHIFGIKVDEQDWEEGVDAVTDRLAGHLERATGIALTGWDSPSRGGVYYEGREEGGGGQSMIVWMRPNFAAESGDWCMDDYREYAVIASVYGSRREQVEELERAVLASRDLGATLLLREIVRPHQRGEFLFSLKDTARQANN
ncbi:hypothetical protein [Pelagibius sp.]|uniref:hypothetical protein n=1 Tax=Pelagibius sp. TaxID=1931238 RepID=UPI003B504375